MVVDSRAVDHGLLDARGTLVGNPFHYRDDRRQMVSSSMSGGWVDLTAELRESFTEGRERAGLGHVTGRSCSVDQHTRTGEGCRRFLGDGALGDGALPIRDAASVQ